MQLNIVILLSMLIIENIFIEICMIIATRIFGEKSGHVQLRFAAADEKKMQGQLFTINIFSGRLVSL